MTVRPSSLLVVPWLLAWLAACGEGAGPGPAAPDLAPGDDWVRSAPGLIVAAAARSVVPAALSDAVTALVERPLVELGATDWGPGPGGQGLVARPGLRLDLAVGTPWVTLDGRVLRPTTNAPGHEQDAEKASVFVDEASGATLFWSAETGRLLLRAREAPQVLALGYHVDERSQLGLLAPGPAVGEPAPAARRVVLGRESRRALPAPAGTVLQAPLTGGLVETLDLVVGVAPLAFAAEADGRLTRRDQAGDGVTFAVELEQGGQRTRLWSRHVTADEGWVPARVDLPAGPGQLSLVSEAGPDDDPSWDLGLWARLRFDGPPRQPPRRPHVVLIDVDTLRADRLGCYGHERDTSPRLDAWAAAQATVFLDATAPGTWTLPSTVSMLTGLAATQHGVTAFPRRVTAELEPLAARLAAVGYETWGRVDGGFVSAPFGFDVGFDVYDYQRLPWHEHERQGWSDVLASIAERRSERPLFVFLQTYQVHMPFREDRRYDDPAAPYDGALLDVTLQKGPIDAARARGELTMGPADWRWLNDLYDAGVRRMDDVVGPFLEGLDQALGGEPCLVLLTSDHGEELSERDGLGHGHSVHREVVAVPLILRAPTGDRVGVSEAPASGLDLVPTVLAAAGLAVPDQLPGRDLLALDERPRLVVAEHGEQAFAARFDGWTLLRQEGQGRPRLFDHRDDPGERRDLSAAQGQRAATLAARLEDWRDGLPLLRDGAGAEQDVGAALVSELQALGYLGGDER